MLQLDNSSPFPASLAVLPDERGADTLQVVVRATFSLTPRCALAEVPREPSLADEFWGDPAASSLKYVSELHLGKPGTDVALIGQAWAPRERPVEEMMVALSVAGRRKLVRVLGNRVWKRGGGFSRPLPFANMPLTWERAFGGTDQSAGVEIFPAEERNPVGVGFRGRRRESDGDHQPLPNLEDPGQPLAAFGDAPPPACFALVAPSWQPRRQYAGTYDERWKKTRAPFLPADFDRRFFHAATGELVFERPLAGGEPISLLGGHRDGPVDLRLPVCRLDVAMQIAGQEQPLQPRLETVLLEPDDNRLSLTFRASGLCGKRPLAIERVRVTLDGLET